MMSPMSSGLWLLRRRRGFRLRLPSGAARPTRLGRVTGVAADPLYFLIRLAPIGDRGITIRLVVLESRAILDNRNTRLGIHRISARGWCLGGCCACGKHRKRQERWIFHGSLDDKARAANARDRRAQGARQLQRTSESEWRSIKSGQPNADRLLVRSQVEKGKNFAEELRLHRTGDRGRCATSRTRAAMRSRRSGIVGIG